MNPFYAIKLRLLEVKTAKADLCLFAQSVQYRTRDFGLHGGPSVTSTETSVPG